jgi:hypothetical protein
MLIFYSFFLFLNFVVTDVKVTSIKYTVPWTGFKLTTLVVIQCRHCTSSCKSIYDHDHKLNQIKSMCVLSSLLLSVELSTIFDTVLRFWWFYPTCLETNGLVWFMVFNTTFNNIPVILWWSVLLMEETGVPRENHRNPQY